MSSSKIFPMVLLFGLLASCLHSSKEEKLIKIGFTLETKLDLISEIYAQTLQINNYKVLKVHLKEKIKNPINLLEEQKIDLIPTETKMFLDNNENCFKLNKLESDEKNQENWDNCAISVLPQSILLGDRLDFSIFYENSFSKIAPLFNYENLDKYSQRVINRVSGELNFVEFNNLYKKLKINDDISKLVEEWISQRVLVG